MLVPELFKKIIPEIGNAHCECEVEVQKENNFEKFMTYPFILK